LPPPVEDLNGSASHRRHREPDDDDDHDDRCTDELRGMAARASDGGSGEGPALHNGEIARRDLTLGSFAKPSPPATGSSGTQRPTAGSNRVQVAERLAER